MPAIEKFRKEKENASEYQVPEKMDEPVLDSDYMKDLQRRVDEEREKESRNPQKREQLLHSLEEQPVPPGQENLQASMKRGKEALEILKRESGGEEIQRQPLQEEKREANEVMSEPSLSSEEGVLGILKKGREIIKPINDRLKKLDKEILELRHTFDNSSGSELVKINKKMQAIIEEQEKLKLKRLVTEEKTKRKMTEYSGRKKVNDEEVNTKKDGQEGADNDQEKINVRTPEEPPKIDPKYAKERVGSGQKEQSAEKNEEEAEEKLNTESSYINPKDDFEALEIGPDASEEEIKRAYWRMALKFHPDRNPGEQEKYNKRFQRIQQAYENLKGGQGNKNAEEEFREWVKKQQEEIRKEQEEERRRKKEEQEGLRKAKIKELVRKLSGEWTINNWVPEQLWNDTGIFLKSEEFLNAKDPELAFGVWQGDWLRNHPKEVADHEKEQNKEQDRRYQELKNRDKDKYWDEMRRKAIEEEKRMEDDLKRRNAEFRAEQAARKEREKNNPSKPKSFFKKIFGG